MNRYRQIAAIPLLCLSALLVTSCGFNDAMDATKTMPEKLDKTNDQVTITNHRIAYTNKQIERTNEEMTEMKAYLDSMLSVMENMNQVLGSTLSVLGQMSSALAAMQSSLVQMQKTMLALQHSTQELSSSTHELAAKIDSTNAKIDSTNAAIAEMNRKMEKTNAAIHKQVLVDALAEMQKPENTRYLFPPTGMMAAGQAFAEEATPDEVTQLVYVYLKDIDEVQPDDSLRGRDGKFPQSVITQMDHEKMVKFTMLEVIAGLMPQVNVQTAVQTQIFSGGRYDGAVNSLLMLRTLFIKSILLEEDLFSKKIDDLGKLQTGIEDVRDLDWIARLPFAASISVKTDGMLDPDDNINEKLNPRMTVPLWDHLAMSVSSELDPAKVGNSADAQLRLQKYKDTIKRYQDSWKGSTRTAFRLALD